MVTMREKTKTAALQIVQLYGCNISPKMFEKLLDILELERKLQDRDTRHACAESCLKVAHENKYSDGTIYHNACINTIAP